MLAVHQDLLIVIQRRMRSNEVSVGVLGLITLICASAVPTPHQAARGVRREKTWKVNFKFIRFCINSDFYFSFHILVMKILPFLLTILKGLIMIPKTKIVIHKNSFPTPIIPPILVTNVTSLMINIES